MSYTGEASGNSWRGGMRWILRDAQASFCSRACKGAGLSMGGVPRGYSIGYITTSIRSSYDISCTTTDDYREVGASIQAHSRSGKIFWTLFMTAFGPRVSVA